MDETADYLPTLEGRCKSKAQVKPDDYRSDNRIIHNAYRESFTTSSGYDVSPSLECVCVFLH